MLHRLARPLYGESQAPMPPETTALTPLQELSFRGWALRNNIRDVDHPDSFYDYRGFWKDTAGAPHPPGETLHFPDTFKMHGHPTFSIESKYSKGPWDGGTWAGDNYVPQMTPAISHQQHEPTQMKVASQQQSAPMPLSTMLNVAVP